MPAVLVAGGGTGGHIFPGIAIARALMERLPETTVAFVGTERGLETRIVPAAGFRLLTIRSAGITGKRIAARLRGMALIPVSLAQSFALLGKERPGLVIGVGGYASGPVLAAAVLRRTPTLIHEQNYVPGVTNRFMAPFATEVVVTFEETIQYLRGRGIALGNPVRAEFTRIGPRTPDEAGLRLLVFGGSQGARVINHAMCDALPLLAPIGGRLRVVHQTGPSQHAEVAAAYAAAGFGPDRADVRPFIDDMPHVVEEIDLVVCRSGATTVAELTAAGRPSILVPFARATHDHQTWNARKLERAGAAMLLPESRLDGATLARSVIELATDPPRLARMAEASRALGRPDAAERIAERCATLLSRGRAA